MTKRDDIERSYIERFGLCPDHRDKPTGVCPLCTIETLRRERDQARAELDRLKLLLNTPEIDNFELAVQIEQAHQRERWGAGHDELKTAGDWAMLLDKIKGKQCQAVWDGDFSKLKHHLVTMAAICFNYHRCIGEAKKS